MFLRSELNGKILYRKQVKKYYFRMILNVKHIYFRVFRRNLFFLCTTIILFVEIRMYRTELYLFCDCNYAKETMIVKNGSDDILSSYWNNEEGAFQVRYSCIQRVEDKLT